MSSKDKIITIRQFSVLILILSMYAIGIRDLISASIGLIFVLAVAITTIKLDRDGTIRDDIEIIDYFSFKHYIRD